MHFSKGSWLWEVFQSREATRLKKMETRTRRFWAGGRRRREEGGQWADQQVCVGRRVGSAPPPALCPPLAYLPDEAITLGGRWCLVWRGSKGHCDRGLGPIPGPRPLCLWSLTPPPTSPSSFLFCAPFRHVPILALLVFLFSVPLSSAPWPCLPVSASVGPSLSAASPLPWALRG